MSEVEHKKLHVGGDGVEDVRKYIYMNMKLNGYTEDECRRRFTR